MRAIPSHMPKAGVLSLSASEGSNMSNGPTRQADIAINNLGYLNSFYCTCFSCSTMFYTIGGWNSSLLCLFTHKIDWVACGPPFLWWSSLSPQKLRLVCWPQQALGADMGYGIIPITIWSSNVENPRLMIFHGNDDTRGEFHGHSSPWITIDQPIYYPLSTNILSILNHYQPLLTRGYQQKSHGRLFGHDPKDPIHPSQAAWSPVWSFAPAS